MTLGQLQPYKRIIRSGRLSILPAVLAAAILHGGFHSAFAADLGGACCADLEERIAELEAAAARKGNRKVSLTISGQVNQALLAFDDGDEQQLYQVSNSNSSNRVRFEGRAKISSDLRVGYYLEMGVGSASSSGSSQRGTGGSSDDEANVRASVIYMESKKFGAVSMGLAASASDDIIGYNLGSTNVAASANASLVGGGMFTRDSSLGGESGLNSLSSGNTMSLRWRRFMPGLDTPQQNIVRYDSPVIEGAAFSASWGEDDFWDVAVRYARETETVKVSMGVAFVENSTEQDDTFGWPPGGDNEEDGGNTVIREVKGSASFMHVPSGVFVSGAYVHREFSGSDLGVLTFACFGSGDAADIRAAGISCSNREDLDYYWVNAGLKRKFFSLGWTSLYGEYGQSSDAVTGLNVSVASAAGGDIDYVTSSSMNLWGVGIVQNINSAAMDVYFAYRNYSADVVGLESSGSRIEAPLEDLDLFMAGSRIRF